MPDLTARLRPGLAYAALLAVATATGAGSCERDAAEPVPEPAPPTERAHVDERLLVYFDRYEAEAEARGIVVDLSAFQLTASIDSMFVGDNADAVGVCVFDPDAPNRLRVNAETWDNPRVPDELREYIVFHELGHCERLRKHREDKDPDDVCVSVMASGTGACRPVYSAANREQLLDELFDETFYGDGF